MPFTVLLYGYLLFDFVEMILFDLPGYSNNLHACLSK